MPSVVVIASAESQGTQIALAAAHPEVAGAIDSATVLLPDDLPSCVSPHPNLDRYAVRRAVA